MFPYTLNGLLSPNGPRRASYYFLAILIRSYICGLLFVYSFLFLDQHMQCSSLILVYHYWVLSKLYLLHYD
jgi:hypothetical protein